jgi:hypothetical protein
MYNVSIYKHQHAAEQAAPGPPRCLRPCTVCEAQRAHAHMQRSATTLRTCQFILLAKTFSLGIPRCAAMGRVSSLQAISHWMSTCADEHVRGG